MIKDVKSYVNAVGKRLSRAFSMEEFGTEEQLEFWELSAEHVSRAVNPNFSDIVNWMDLLYRAPVHFVYELKENKLVLQRRHVFTENIIKGNKNKKLPHEETQQEKEFVKDFEYQLQNLEKKMDMDEIFLEHGVTAHSIGQCEHIPLYTPERELWGIYCAGPYTKSPEQIVPKMSIVGRMLSDWLITLEEEENNPQKDYEHKIQEVVSDLGSGKLNAPKIAQVLLRYVTHVTGGKIGAILEFTPKGHQLTASLGFSDKEKEYFDAKGDKVVYTLENEELKLSAFGEELFKEWDRSFEEVKIISDHFKGCVLVEQQESLKNESSLKVIGDALSNLFSYRYENQVFSEQLMDAYYAMLRQIERSRNKTKYHTPRMIAFVQRFGMFFGLEEDEMDIIIKTAKLHDIGYVGAQSIEPDKSIGGELTHPLIGANLIEQLSVHEDVVEGIRTHQEWVNGQGSPQGLGNDQIPWTGKIIALFEYVVDFIESNGGDDSKTDEEWLELLQQDLVKRADIEFDMVLVPTAIQLIQALGWDGCLSLGAGDES